jgi:hypothetical protein
MVGADRHASAKTNKKSAPLSLFFVRQCWCLSVELAQKRHNRSHRKIDDTR